MNFLLQKRIFQKNILYLQYFKKHGNCCEFSCFFNKKVKYERQHKVSQYNICLKTSLPFTKNLKTEYLLKEKEKNVIVAHDLKGYIYNLDKLDEVNYNVGESNLLNKIFKIIKATTDEERKSIAEGSEFLMDVVTQIRKFLYDEETKEMKNIQDKWKREARKEGLANGMAQGMT